MNPIDAAAIMRLGTRVLIQGRWATVDAVGWVGERYYWFTYDDGTVARRPAEIGKGADLTGGWEE